MTTSHRGRSSVSTLYAIGIFLWTGAASTAIADPPPGEASAASAAEPAGAPETEPNSLPQDGLFSSIKQNLRESEQEVVRGHFDLGSPPNVRRYYCLVDPKTGRHEPNGVVGDPVTRPDGMTGIKISAVSMYLCAKAEQKGYLVSAGYVLHLPRHARASSPPPPPPPSAAAGSSAAAPVPAPAPAAAAAPASHMPAAPVSPDRIDVAGIKLGMSPDEVRAVLKSKNLLHNKEWNESLSFLAGGKGPNQPIANGRFVNVIAAWTPSVSPASAEFEGNGESFEIMFTPVPGAERVMAIIHTQGFSQADAIHETALDAGLVKKYGGYLSAGDLPESVTWRFQGDGSVQVGDACGRRAAFGGLGGLSVSSAPRENVALRKTPDELRAEVERCGNAMVTADHFTPNGGALPADRLVTRFTVTAFSPAIALEGAKRASQLIQAAGRPAPEARPSDVKAPDL